MSPKFKKQAEYRREREQRRQQEVAVAQDAVKARANHFVLLMERFIYAAARHQATQAIEDQLSLNKAREEFTEEIVKLIETDHQLRGV